MGEVIQFTGEWHGRPRVIKMPEAILPPLSREEMDVLDTAQEVLSDVTHESTVRSESLAYGPNLKRRIDDGEGEWTAVRLSNEPQIPRPKLRSV